MFTYLLTYVLTILTFLTIPAVWRNRKKAYKSKLASVSLRCKSCRFKQQKIYYQQIVSTEAIALCQAATMS